MSELARGDAARADDLAQETFIKAYRAIRTFRGEAGFASWLYRIAYHTFLNDLRTRRETVAYDESHATETAPSPAPHSDLAHDLEHAMTRLSDEQVVIFDLAYKKGLSQTEVATALNLPVGTVKTRLTRGLATLRDVMHEWTTRHARNP